ncbi:MAG: hypothetical protein ACRDJE_02620 [Dehalococcoidia bacterium]
MREAILRPPARAYYSLMSDAERDAIDRRIRRLEHDPSPDGRTTFAVSDIDGLFLYDDGIWQMAYAVSDNATLVIRSIAHALDLPP